jgi:hypothetical protein
VINWYTPRCTIGIRLAHLECTAVNRPHHPARRTTICRTRLWSQSHHDSRMHILPKLVPLRHRKALASLTLSWRSSPHAFVCLTFLQAASCAFESNKCRKQFICTNHKPFAIAAVSILNEVRLTADKFGKISRSSDDHITPARQRERSGHRRYFGPQRRVPETNHRRHRTAMLNASRKLPRGHRPWCCSLRARWRCSSPAAAWR